MAGARTGQVFVDGKLAGDLPLELPNLTPGTYHVRVVMVDGTVWEENVEVGGGAAQRVFVESSPKQAAGMAHAGAHFGFEMGGGIWVSDEMGSFGGGVVPGVFVNFGASPTIDVRLGARVFAGTIDSQGLVVLAGGTAGARFNLTSVYTIGFGAMFGLWSANPDVEVTSRCAYAFYCYYTVQRHETGFFLGPEATFATFRFGPQRQFEVGLTHGLALPVLKPSQPNLDHVMILYNNVTFSMLLL